MNTKQIFVIDIPL